MGWEGGERVEIAVILYALDLVLCGDSEEDLRVMVGRFVGVLEKRSESQCR